MTHIILYSYSVAYLHVYLSIERGVAGGTHGEGAAGGTYVHFIYINIHSLEEVYQVVRISYPKGFRCLSPPRL